MTAEPSSPLSRAIWAFPSQFFLVPQGMGIVAVILHQLDYRFRGLSVLARIVWIYTICLLGIMLPCYTCRLLRYPKHARFEFRHDLVETSCLSSITITYSTIILMAALQYGKTYESALGIYVLWWVDAFLSTASVMVIPYVQLTLQPSGKKRIPCSILLPVISALTCAAVGGAICQAMPLSPRLAVPLVVVAYMLVGIGTGLGLAYDAVLLFQYFSDNYPPVSQVWQDMILCGPFGQAGYALQVLGSVVKKSFPAYGQGTLLTEEAAVPISAVSQFAAVLSWGFATLWWMFAILSIVHTVVTQPGGISKTTFSMGAWSLVFPWVRAKGLLQRYESAC